MARTPEQNHQYYLNRVERAISEGYGGYGEKRSAQERERSQESIVEKALENLKEQFPGLEIIKDVAPLTPERQKAFDILENSGRYTQEELDDLLDYDYEDFWDYARPMLDALSGNGTES